MRPAGFYLANERPLLSSVVGAIFGDDDVIEPFGANNLKVSGQEDRSESRRRLSLTMRPRVRWALHVDWLMDFCLRCSGLWKCVSAQVRNDPEIYAHGESLTVLWEDLQKVSKGRPSILRRLQLRPKPGSAADDGWINVNAVCAISSLCNPLSEDPKYPLKCWFCLSTLSFEAMLSA